MSHQDIYTVEKLIIYTIDWYKNELFYFYFNVSRLPVFIACKNPGGINYARSTGAQIT